MEDAATCGRVPATTTTRARRSSWGAPCGVTSRERATELGRLAGVHAVGELVHGALVVAAETRAEMVAAFPDAAVLHRRFFEVADDLRAGQALRHEAGAANAAFRPNFYSRKADEFFFSEEWTEAVLRYAMAGETLVREVMAAVADAIGMPELVLTDKLNQFNSLGEAVAKRANISLAKEPAWVELTRIYGLRNRHGLTDIHHEGRSPGEDARHGDRGEEKAPSPPFVHPRVQGRHRRALPARRVPCRTAVVEEARKGLLRCHTSDVPSVCSTGRLVQHWSACRRRLTYSTARSVQ